MLAQCAAQRNLDDLRALVQGLAYKGLRVELLMERLASTGEDPPMANLMLSIRGPLAEYERSLIRERRREGIAFGQAPRSLQRPKKTLPSERAAELVPGADTVVPKAVLARDYGISRETAISTCATPSWVKPLPCPRCRYAAAEAPTTGTRAYSISNYSILLNNAVGPV